MDSTDWIEQMGKECIRKTWTPEENEYLKNNYCRCKIDNLAEYLGRSRQSVISHANRIGINTRWSEIDDAYLEEWYGRKNIKQLAKELNRTYQSVNNRLRKLGFGAFTEQSDAITVSEISRIMGCNKNTIQYWIDNYDLHSVKKGKFRMVRIQTLITWMENNQSRWKAIKCEKYLFDNYPWFHEKLLKEREEAHQKRWKEVS